MERAELKGFYGGEVAQLLRLSSAPSFVSRSLRKSAIAVTQIISSGPNSQDPTPASNLEDAFLIALWLRNGFEREMWVDGKAIAPSLPLPSGVFTFLDLRQSGSALIKSGFHSVQIYIPRYALNVIAGEAGSRRIDELHLRPGVGVNDAVVLGLGQSLLPAFERPEEVNQLFIDHVTHALGLHVAHAYSGIEVKQGPAKGGLASWQEKRVKELLDTNLSGDISLEALACECRISTRHFSRAFRQSVGMPPHRWLLRRRVEKARGLLRESKLTMSEIAAVCSFADQSHFTRVFSRITGVSPSAWRRQTQGPATRIDS